MSTLRTRLAAWLAPVAPLADPTRPVEWDRLREEADTAQELSEVDAVFGRHAA